MMRPDATTYLPSPNFTCVAPQCKFIAGLRPYRKGSYRLEHESIGNKFVVHNYGHGGAGISMSWGCADAVRQIVRAYSAPEQHKRIAVLGAGVMGLTAATLLAGEYNVSIYAELISCTTSEVAGGQWAPSVVCYDETDAAAKQRFETILRTAFRMHEQRIGQGFGVSRRINYTKRKSETFKKVPLDVIPAPDEFTHLPFARLRSHGYGYHTLLVEPPIFLKRLRDDLQAQNIRPQQQVFRTVDDILHLPEEIIINCTGLGSKIVFNDQDLLPKKGQLVLLPSQPALQWLYSTGSTYVFPREDHVVVGGTYEETFHDDQPEPGRCEDIRRMAEDVFAGRALAAKFRNAPWLMRNK
ncbi:FAD-dependent oxidoreductase (plasmid) [Rhizobium ruizarguesonis]|nr:FAD-dependent oxidoreductase [Rhizobium ruizarguesonis]